MAEKKELSFSEVVAATTKAVAEVANAALRSTVRAQVRKELGVSRVLEEAVTPSVDPGVRLIETEEVEGELATTKYPAEASRFWEQYEEWIRRSAGLPSQFDPETSDLVEVPDPPSLHPAYECAGPVDNMNFLGGAYQAICTSSCINAPQKVEVEGVAEEHFVETFVQKLANGQEIWKAIDPRDKMLYIEHSVHTATNIPFELIDPSRNAVKSGSFIVWMFLGDKLIGFIHDGYVFLLISPQDTL